MYGQRNVHKRWLTLLATTFFVVASFQPISAHESVGDSGMSPEPKGPAIPITVDIPTNGLLLNLDPALADTSDALSAAESLFLGLTDIDPVSGEIVPELATDWSVSEDGLVWTFYLRDDVNWIQYDPTLQVATPVRRVVASDVVNGIKRSCDPSLGAPNGSLLAGIIVGCDVVYQTMQLNVTNEQLAANTIEVFAPDDTTVVIHLQESISYFLAITTLAAMRPIPAEVIESYGLDWTNPKKIVTNGAFLLHEIEPSTYRIFVRNHALPADLQYDGNIERVVYHVIPDRGSQFAVYNDHVIDISTITPISLQSVLTDPAYTNQVLRLFDISIYYFGFDHQEHPFDNIHVRRAFSAILDRQAFIDQLNFERGIPIERFTPPGYQPSPYIESDSVRYDPIYAREEMAAAGYPNCEGFPEITIMTFRNATEWGSFLANVAAEQLGCDPDLFEIMPMVNTIFGPDIHEANIWTGVWQPSYPDVHAWIGEGIGCEGQNALRRPCADIDQAIADAAVESDLEIRQEMYAEIESLLFGTDGEVPLTPIFVEAGAFLLVKPWFRGPFNTDGIFGAIHWDAYHINMAEKLAVRTNN